MTNDFKSIVYNCPVKRILSDIFDRRSILLISCTSMFSISVILGILTLIGLTTPTILLIVIFVLGAGMTMIRTILVSK
jgi:Transmembrane secretion effector